MAEHWNPGLQPLLHELWTCLRAPTVALSAADGQLRPSGAQGVYSADLRVLSRAEITVDDGTVEPVSAAARGADGAEFLAVLRSLGDPGPDPTVWLRRSRRVGADGMHESLTVVNASAGSLCSRLRLRLAADLADIETVKLGRPSHPVAGELTPTGVTFRTSQVQVRITGNASFEARNGEAGGPATEVEACWDIEVGPRSECELNWSVSVVDTGAAVIRPAVWASVPALRVQADDRRLGPLLDRCVSDLDALRLATPAMPDDIFYGAGSPWYLTLFGRDSIWAARLALPLGTEPAAGTLRTLAARQGSGHNDRTAEEPGKILHEVRRPTSSLDTPFLPPVYYGTVDATALWVCLLADAWRWGLPANEVEQLLPAAERALSWMADSGDSDGDGFLEYVDSSGRGLTNQGWKDSGDSVRFADGRIATGPVALAEVQGYAYQAAVSGADLLEHFHRPGADRWRSYAATLADRFRDKFWAVDDLGPYPALALDGAKRLVDAPASNMGHLLATGILSESEARSVADRLVHPSMSSGFGLRTMSARAGGYSPLSYHCGSVWPHDTAIAVHGLIQAGFGGHAATLAAGLLAAGDAFDGRLPELFAGFDAADIPVPVPYPASCRPQAWSAAAAIVLIRALLGLEVDAPAGTITLAPSAAAGALAVSGMAIAGAELSVTVSATGEVSAVQYDGPLTVQIRG